MKVVCFTPQTERPALVALQSALARHAPDWELEVVAAGPASRARLGFDSEPLLARYGPEITTWWVALRLVGAEAAAGTRALHLPPGAWLVADPGPLIELLSQAHVVCGQYSLTAPGGEAGEPTAAQLRSVGRLDPSLLGADGSPESVQVLNRWRQRLLRALSDPRDRSGPVPPHRLAWLRAGLEFARLRGELHAAPRALNLSGWNAWSARLGDGPDGTVSVDGAPLTLLNLTGYDPGRPYLLGPHSSRFRLGEHPRLAALLADYQDQLLAAGWSDATQRALIGARLPDGSLCDGPRWRQLTIARQLGEDFGDISTPAGNEAFNRWLEQPAPGDLMPGISRYLAYRLLDERHDVAEAFGALDVHNRAFVRWCHDHGADELPIPDRFLPADPATDASAAPVPSPPSGGGAGPAPRVRFSGYLSHVLGLGVAARSYGDALEQAGVEVENRDVIPEQPDRPDDLAADYGTVSFTPSPRQDGGVPEVDLIAVNVDGLQAFVERMGEGYFSGHRVGLWAWEADPLPPAWRGAYTCVDEVWAMSRYTADVLSADAPVPVLAMAPPVSPPALTVAPHRLGLPDGFLFLFIFDYFSTVERKNPLGLIDAFSRAFAPGSGPRLLLKTLNGPRSPELDQAVRWAAAGREDISVIDASLSSGEKNALIAGCDCYVSLHRSEGFGLTLAEAMHLGKPVIATGYSGNLDFMDGENSFLVDYRLTHVGPDGGIYPADARWADPDRDHAAELMRRVHGDPALAAGVATRGAQRVRDTLSPAVRGADMRRHLERLARS